jgi:hypothetical protein
VIVERYRPSNAAAWDAFVRHSRNGTFLFERGYTDYHRDRFVDYSLMIRDDEGTLVALLPAHVDGNRVSSHDGLSYGGLVIGPNGKSAIILQALEAALMHFAAAGFTLCDYKTVPHIYHRQPAEDDRYAMFLLGATLTRRDVLSVAALDDRLPYQHRRARGVKKAEAAGVTVQTETDFAEYWCLLAATLADRYGAEPVHSLDEIQELRDRFPENIRLFTARTGTELLAGVVTYDSDRAAHAQYIAASPDGRRVCALDLVLDRLLHDTSRDHAYFDFGSSHEEAGRIINSGLIEQKEGFGARSVTHDRYRIDLTTIRPGILTGAFR